MKQPYRIIVGYDCSLTADLALRSAFDQAAKEPGAEVHLVHVLSSAAHSRATSSGAAAISVEEQTPEGVQLRPSAEENVTVRAVRERAMEIYADWVDAHKPAFSRVITHLRYDDPANEIAQLATDLPGVADRGGHPRRAWFQAIFPGLRGRRRHPLGSLSHFGRSTRSRHARATCDPPAL